MMAIMSIGRLVRELEVKGAAAAQDAFGPNAAAMVLDDLLHDRQSEALAVFKLRGIGLGLAAANFK